MQQVSSCCVVKKETTKADENPYMTIAAPQYTTLTSANISSKPSCSKNKSTESSEHSSLTTFSHSANPEYVQHQAYSPCSLNGGNHAFIRSENMLHYYASQNRNLDSKSFPPFSNSFAYRDGNQVGSYRDLARRKPGTLMSFGYHFRLCSDARVQ